MAPCFTTKKVRDEIKNANVILPSLDAATESIFQKLNLPAPQLKVDNYIQGLIDFRKEYSGQIWLEVFSAPGYNDNIDDLNALKNAIQKIKPDRVQLNTLDRPGAEQDILDASHADLKKIVDFWNLDSIEIIATVSERKSKQSYRKDAETAILNTIIRRPCTADDIMQILRLHINEINKYLAVLETENRIYSVRQERSVFYKIK